VVADAGDYLARALAYLAPAPPRLVAVGGRSGTGKSTLARRLAPGLGPAPGAVVLRSDVVRKRLHGVPPSARLGPEAYRREVTRDVYRTLARRADALVRAGHGAIVDAVFLDPAERAEIEQIAAAAGIPFQGFWLDADADVLLGRVAARRGDASDATAEVLRRQLAIDPGAVRWRKLDASRSIDAMVAEVRTELANGRT
jgi:predicted kinase